MRAGLDAPTESVSAESAARLRDFLDRQRPIALAVWVRHEQQAIEGPLFDHHTMLGIDDEMYAGADLWALECGIELECAGIPGWLDLFPLSEVEALRAFGEVLWERPQKPGNELDPLSFRFTWEPLDAPPDAVATFARLVRPVPELRRVEASRELLWKNGQKVRARANVWLDFAERRPGDFERVDGALRESVLGAAASSVSAELPRDERIRTAVLYER